MNNPYYMYTTRSQVEELDSDEEYESSEIRYPDEVLTEESDIENDEYYSETEFDEFEDNWNLSPFHVIRFVFTESTEDEGYGEFVFELPLSPITFSLASSLLYDVERLVIDRIREEQLQELEHEEERKRKEAQGVTEEILQKLPLIMYSQTEEEDVCAICLCDFENGESLKVLPCTHHFHPMCIDKWLLQKRQCPLCKAAIGNSVKEMLELFKQKQEQVLKLQQTPRTRTPRTPSASRMPRITSATRRTSAQRPATSKPSLVTPKPSSNVNNNSPTSKSSASKQPISSKHLRKSESTSALPPATKPPTRTASITKKSEIPSLSTSKLPPIRSPRTLADKPKASPKSSKMESLPKRF